MAPRASRAKGLPASKGLKDKFSGLKDTLGGLVESTTRIGPAWMQSRAAVMALKLVVGVVIIIIGHHAGVAAQAATTKALQRGGTSGHSQDAQAAAQGTQPAKSPLVAKTAGVVVYWSIMFVTLILLLGTLGVEVTGIIAIAGTLGFALGLSLQGFLTDVAAGMMLGFTNRYSIGDLITTNGVTGTVVSFSLLTTVLHEQGTETPITIPNSKVYGDVLTSVASRWDKPQRTTLVVVTIANTNRVIAPALEAVKAAVAAVPLVLPQPPVTVGVGAVTALGTDVNVRFSLNPDDMRIKNNSSLTGRVTTVVRATLVAQGIDLVTCCGVAGVAAAAGRTGH